MKKNFMFGSVIVAVLLLGTGCGGGSSSNSDDDSSAGASASTEKTGYYLDSAVGGVSYSCVSEDVNGEGGADASANGTGVVSDGNNSSASVDGAGTASDGNGTATGDAQADNNNSASKKSTGLQKEISGTTNADGSFKFKDGQVCTFSIGGVILRELNTTGLADNAIVLEDNSTVARFLQTLDKDNNPEGGIQIDPAVSATISSGNLIVNNTIPSTDEDLSNLVSKLKEQVSTYNGQMVTEEEAQSHLAETRVRIESMDGIMELSTDGASINIGGSSSSEGGGSLTIGGSSSSNGEASVTGDSSSTSGGASIGTDGGSLTIGGSSSSDTNGSSSTGGGASLTTSGGSIGVSTSGNSTSENNETTSTGTATVSGSSSVDTPIITSPMSGGGIGI